MSVNPDPRAHVASTEDFYSLLSIADPGALTPEILQKSYRRAALKYHPDRAVKPGASEADKERVREKWDLFEVGYKVLKDAALRAQYDTTRAAREQKRLHNAALDAERRAMIERLERAEREADLRRRGLAVDDDEGRDEREARRLAADGKRKRDELNARRRAEAEALAKAEAEVDARAGSGSEGRSRVDVEYERFWDALAATLDKQLPAREEAPAEERTIKVTFKAGTDRDAADVRDMFDRFGSVDAVVPDEDKQVSLDPGSEGQLLSQCYVQFARRFSTIRAVAKWHRWQQQDRVPRSWKAISDVSHLRQKTSSDIDPVLINADGTKTGDIPSFKSFRWLENHRSDEDSKTHGPSHDMTGAHTGKSRPVSSSKRTKVASLQLSAEESKLFQDSVKTKMRERMALREMGS